MKHVRNMHESAAVRYLQKPDWSESKSLFLSWEENRNKVCNLTFKKQSVQANK